MGKLYPLFFLLLLSTNVFCQITLNATDIPVPTAPFNIDDMTASGPPSPGIGVNQNWNYATYFGNTPTTNTYPLETNSYFTSVGVDVRFDGTKAFNTNLGYAVTTEWDFNANGIFEKGITVPAQSFGLSTFTGNSTDSLLIPAQEAILGSSKVLMQFPLTANSTWQSISPRVTNFNLTVAAFSLNNASAQHRYSLFRSDSIAGWGKLSVHTSGGSSIAYDVLMDKVAQYASDSFYVSGSAASAALLNAFGVTQGQQTNKQYFYNFFRKGSFNYLMRLYYGSDSTYTTLAGAYVSTDNVATVGVKTVDKESYSTFIFPNPVNGNEINVRFMGKVISSVSYVIKDISGRAEQSGVALLKGNDILRITLNNSLTNGHYLLSIKDDSDEEIITEHITIDR